MSRQEANRELVKILQEIVESEPDSRLHQILRNYGFIKEERSEDKIEPTWVNEFYAEPEKVLERVKSYLAK